MTSERPGRDGTAWKGTRTARYLAAAVRISHEEPHHLDRLNGRLEPQYSLHAHSTVASAVRERKGIKIELADSTQQ